MGREHFFDVIYRTVIIVITYMAIVYVNYFVLIPNLLKKKKQFIYGLSLLLLIIIIPYFFVEFDIVHALHKSSHLVKVNYPQNNKPLYTTLFLITLLFIFVSSIIKLVIDAFKQEQDKNIAEKEHLVVENKYMRSQMNPHFFLNALNNLKAINKIAPKQSDKYIDTLANMMRYVTYDCENDTVALKKDIAYIKNYIYFQQVKDKDIKCHISIDVKNEEFLIEPMLLMPFIENAFKYGKFDGNDKLLINIKQSKSELLFYCSNVIDISRVSMRDPSYSGLGIQNVEDRLKIIYPNKYSLKTESKNSTFTVKLVIQTFFNN